MLHLTKADAAWLARLLKVVEDRYYEYPELFSKSDVEDIKIAGELIRSLTK